VKIWKKKARGKRHGEKKLSYVASMEALLQAARKDLVKRRSVQLRLEAKINYIKLLRRCVRGSRIAKEINKALRCRKIEHTRLSFSSDNICLMISIKDTLILLRNLEMASWKKRRELKRLIGSSETWLLVL